MKLTTSVNVTLSGNLITNDAPLLLVGSCFTDEMGARLRQSGFDVLCNPFGTLYNPLSIAMCMGRVLRQELFTEDCLVFHDGLYHSWFHHGSFSHTSAQQVLGQCNESLERTARFLEKSPIQIFTFGTAFAFFLANEESPMYGQVVANCHKLPAREFARRRLSVDEIVTAIQPLMEERRTILTVSPIRHVADGLHGNQLSKSTLLLAVERLCQGGGEYFPSYEIQLDELRDYRFYARDLCHPSDVACDIIYERFQQTYMSAETLLRCQQCEKQFRQSQHRQIHTL